MAKNKGKSKGKASTPGHYTEKGTRKFQSNGPIDWSSTFKRAAGKDGREGEGIRAALAYAVAHESAFLAWAVKHGDEDAKRDRPHAAPKAKPAKPAKPAAKRKPKQLALPTETPAQGKE